MNGADFPNLTAENHRTTIPESSAYNCVAWAAEDVEHWWQPGVFWPLEGDADDCGIQALRQAFESLGYQQGDEEQLEEGFEKVALYGTGIFYTHAARQLPDGKWTSKLGRAEDIEHDAPADLAGGVYGDVLTIMKRKLHTS